MPVDAALIAARLGKPGDLRHSVTDRYEKHPTISAATQANTRYLAKWHVDDAAHSQPVLVRLTVSHGRRALPTSSRPYNHSYAWRHYLRHQSGRRSATLPPTAQPRCSKPCRNAV